MSNPRISTKMRLAILAEFGTLTIQKNRDIDQPDKKFKCDYHIFNDIAERYDLSPRIFQYTDEPSEFLFIAHDMLAGDLRESFEYKKEQEARDRAIAFEKQNEY
jgi:hypothetical protein